MILLKGIMIGFLIGAVIGPIGILCVRRSLADGCFMGLMVGVGSALGDSFYGAIAAFGFTSVSEFLLRHALCLRILGGCYLLYLGIRTFTTRPATQEDSFKQMNVLSTIGSTFFLTITSPVTILAFAAIFTSFGIMTGVTNYTSASILTAGVFLGSGLWMVLLSSTSSLLRSRLNVAAMTRINQLSGFVIALFGLVTLLKK